MQRIKDNKLLKVIGIMFFILMSIINNNNVFAADSTKSFSQGGIYKIEALAADKNMYCLMHNFAWKKDCDYYCYQTGDIDKQIAYIVETKGISNANSEKDLASNAIWEYFAGNANEIAGLDELLDKATVAAQIKESNNQTGNLNLKVFEAPEGFATETENGYGPFVICYPQMIKADGTAELAGGKITISIIDSEGKAKIVEKDTTGLKKFYLTEADGIKKGEKYTIKIMYEAKSYSGTYVLLTPKVEFTLTGTCSACGTKYNNVKKEGFWVPKEDENFDYKEYVKEFYKSENKVDFSSMKSYRTIRLASCKDNCSYNKINVEKVTMSLAEQTKWNNSEGKISNYEGYQDLIYVIPKVKDVSETVEITLNTEVPKITLSGKVWLDGQTGLKPVSGPNGLQDANEKGIANVTVKLYKNTEKDAIKETKTNNNGEYEFTDIPQILSQNEYYYVEFTYDGVNYIAVTANVGNNDAIDSDALELEIDREEFNNKFATIEKNKAIGKDGNEIKLEYTEKDNKAILDTSNMEKFGIKAKAEGYKKTTENIDLGLVKKGVDLSAFTSVDSATVSINGKETKYTYDELNNLKEDVNGNKYIETNNEVSYNMYLYNSDYNYRIGDYKLAESYSIKNNDDTQKILKNRYLQSARTADGDLKVTVKYKILLNNESVTTAKVNKIAYYYDTDYTLILNGKTSVKATLNGKEYNKVILDVNTDLTSQENQKSIYLDFIVNKDNNGNVNLGDMENWVEIISYSTTDGCIDCDSAPDNIDVQDEDDSDDAPVLNIAIAPDAKREIKGYVFEDLKTDEKAYGNGLYDESSEKKVDDVIVQLIEIKEVTVGETKLKLEYIWQETVSGSSVVKYVKMDGQGEGTYNVTNDPGDYTFNQYIIPGDYIVRFIYGDGTYYDVAINGKSSTDASKGNILKYNGQDYKSAIDLKYSELNFNKDNYAENASMARDNEARRLEEMAYATSVTDASKLIIDNKDELTDTWMCAETSLLSIDKTANNIQEPQAVSFGINFGLIKRPAIKLKLEKHVTAVKIDGIGTSTIDMYEGDTGFLTLKSDEIGIIATPTSKNMNHRGLWTIQKQYDEIAGRKLEITYTYRIKNTGAKEFIGNTLLSKLEAGETYKKIAEDVKKDYYNPNSDYLKNKEFGKYLGYWYYTGNPSNDENVTGTTKFKIEDYLSTTNGLQLDTNLTTSFKEIREANKNVWAYEETTSNNKDTVVKEEKVKVLQSGEFELKDSYDDLTLTISKTIDSTSSATNFKYRSYAAQLVYGDNGGKITSLAGTLVEGSKPLEKVQSYVPLSAVSIRELVPEDDEFIAETVEITLDTGDDKFTPVVLIASITAGLAVVAVGIILVKKFVIK